jgi:hypothetical protein
MQNTLILENAGAGALAGGVTTLGQVFLPGELTGGSGLVARHGSAVLPVQLDVKTRYEDGSVKMAVLSLARPELAAGERLELSLEAAPAAAAPALDLDAALRGHSAALTLQGGGGAVTLDVLAALREALADGTASTWQQGPLASQARVEIPLDGSQRLVFDVTAFNNGGLRLEAQFNNDRAMESGGGAATYDLSLRLDGTQVAQEHLSPEQYQNWHASFALDDRNGGQGLGAPEAGWLNIRQDMAHLVATGAVAGYDLDLAVSESLLQRLGAATEAPGWGAPLAVNEVSQYMPGTGGRADIGFTTEANTAWLLSQDARAASYALGQAETASAIPWHLWDAGHGRWLSTDDYPRLWTDSRGGSGAPGDAGSGTLVRPIETGSGWILDSAHQPDLSFVPYLMTGARWMLDNLEAQASWNVVAQWPALRDGSSDLVVNGNQVRGAAWALRQIDEAAWAAPDGSAAQAYFSAVSAANWSWLVSKIPDWTAQQGEAHGWLPGDYGTGGALPPWQQDYFASTAIAAARHGNADALSFLEWQSNFLVGRFLHAQDGFAEHDGAAYLIAISDPATGTPYTSWAQIGAHTAARGWSNGEGWSHSQGDYAQLALATLAAIADLTGSAAATQAYNNLRADQPPFTNTATFANNPTYAIAPPNPEYPNTTLPTSSAPTGVDMPAMPGVSTASLSIRLGGDAWQGNPKAIVTVDGAETFSGEVKASHASGGEEISLGKISIGVEHAITVSFVNDAWDGTSTGDRNLHVEDLLLNGLSTGKGAALMVNGDAHFSVLPEQGGSGTGSPAPDASTLSLSIHLGGDAWRGLPDAVVTVDGVEAFRGEVSASHVSGGMEVALGRVSSHADHVVGVQFLNDDWAGAPDADRNLYVEDIHLGGASTGQQAAMLSNGTVMFQIGDEVPLTSSSVLPDQVFHS